MGTRVYKRGFGKFKCIHYHMYLASYKKRLCGKNDGEIKRHKSCFILRASSGFCFSVGIYGVAKISFW